MELHACDLTAARTSWQEMQAIRAGMRQKNRPLIILLSGVNGIGKTTLSYELSKRLEIKQQIGLGTIVKTLIEFELPPEHRNMAKAMDNCFCLDHLAEQLHEHAQVIARVVNRLVQTHHAQNTHCLIEGVQLLPRHLQLPQDVVHLHLAIDDLACYAAQMAQANPQKYGALSETTLTYLVNLDRALCAEMQVSAQVRIIKHQPQILRSVVNAMHVIYERYVEGR